MNYNTSMQKKLPKNIYNLLKFIGKTGQQMGNSTFVVGGFVRDLIIGRQNLDVDIVIEGDAISFANEFSKAKKGKVTSHESFGTAIVTLPDGSKIDVATARSEVYSRPGALPTVQPGKIEDDLKRRDFTINAMAMNLKDDKFGELVDVLDGFSDLQKHKIKIIHEKSFEDDPTRIFRAIRYEQRYGFSMDRHTEELLNFAIDRNFLTTITKQRIRNEILLILNEENASRPLNRMRELNLMRYIHPELLLNNRKFNLIYKITEMNSFMPLPFLKANEKVDYVLIKLMILLDGLNETDAIDISERLALNKKYTEALKSSVTRLPKALLTISEETATPSEIYKALKDLTFDTLIYSIFKGGRDSVYQIMLYLTVLRDTKPLITGKDLIELGYTEGPIFNEILTEVFNAQLDEEIKTKQEAIEFIKSERKDK
jgi:tRNA nucleotidyltransferase (CCA-adding enzyme)